MLLKVRKNKKGFTLIELIVVVAILAILAAIAVPQFIGLQNTAKQAVAKANASTVASTVNVFNASQTTPVIKSSNYPTTLSALNTLLTTNYTITISGSTADQNAAVTNVTVDANGIATVNSTLTVP